MRRHLIAGVLLMAIPASEAAAGRYLGKTFPAFTAVDALSGEIVALDSLRGKAVIVDFWATWCAPCRHELPNVKAVYEQFHDQGLEVVGISLDKSLSQLRTFVAKSGMDWSQVMEGGGWNSPLVRQYGVTSIPRLFVIDRNGICIAENARGRNLEIAARKALAVAYAGADDEPMDPVAARLMERLAVAQNVVQRTLPPLSEISERLEGIETSLEFSPEPGSERVARALARRLEALRRTLIDKHATLYRLGILDREDDPALAREPADVTVLREAAGRMLAACEAARAQLAWVDDGLGVLHREVIAGSKSPETLEREVTELHEHAMQLAATWCGQG